MMIRPIVALNASRTLLQVHRRSLFPRGAAEAGPQGLPGQSRSTRPAQEVLQDTPNDSRRKTEGSRTVGTEAAAFAPRPNSSRQGGLGETNSITRRSAGRRGTMERHSQAGCRGRGGCSDRHRQGLSRLDRIASTGERSTVNRRPGQSTGLAAGRPVLGAATLHADVESLLAPQPHLLFTPMGQAMVKTDGHSVLVRIQPLECSRDSSLLSPGTNTAPSLAGPLAASASFGGTVALAGASTVTLVTTMLVRRHLLKGALLLPGRGKT